VTWLPENGKRKRGRPKSPGVALPEDLKNVEMTWNYFGEVADNRSMWKSCVAKCAKVR